MAKKGTKRKPITPNIISVGEDSLAQKDLATENKRLKAQIHRLERYVAELEHAADTDPLVPVFNRRAFMRELSRAQSVLDRYDIPSCVIFFDLDGFKTINDRYGHAVGDKLLFRVGETLLKGVRKCDVVARIGGDEFGVLLFQTHPDLAKAKARTLASRISDIEIDFPPIGKIKVSATWGTSVCSDQENAEKILARADHNMYASKNVRRSFRMS